MNDNRRTMFIRDFISVWRDLDFAGASSEEIAFATDLSLEELRDLREGKQDISIDRIESALMNLRLLNLGTGAPAKPKKLSLQ